MKRVLLFLVMNSHFAGASYIVNKTPFEDSVKVAQLEKVTSPRRKVSKEVHDDFIDSLDRSSFDHDSMQPLESRTHEQIKVVKSSKNSCFSRFFCFLREEKVCAGLNENE